MSPSTDRSPLARTRRVGRLALLSFLFLGISGAPAYLVQGIAWWQMAIDAGGMDHLEEAMFEVEPCHLCHFAQDLNRGNPESPESPAPTERVEALRLMAVIVDHRSAPRPKASAGLRPLLRASSDEAPRDRSERPLTPPPQRVVPA